MEEITYKEKKIEIKEDKDIKKLFVDGKEIEFLLDPLSGTFSCQRLPYSRYSSLEDLGRALIDN
ncbi:MAG: hypothetical protein ACE5RG_07815 [Candidatus Nitrosomaritimum yanchengensis]